MCIYITYYIYELLILGLGPGNFFWEKCFFGYLCRPTSERHARPIRRSKLCLLAEIHADEAFNVHQPEGELLSARIELQIIRTTPQRRIRMQTTYFLLNTEPRGQTAEQSSYSVLSKALRERLRLIHYFLRRMHFARHSFPTWRHQVWKVVESSTAVSNKEHVSSAEYYRQHASHSHTS